MDIDLKYNVPSINKYRIGMESIKRKRRCQVDCRDHLLILQCLKPNSSKYDVKLPFCPKFQRDPLPPQYIHPQFNNDYKYYTSAFILGVDRRALVKNEQQEIMDHQKQVRDSLEKMNQLIFPRPNSKHSHCSVCKEHYKNYYLHVSSEQHRERIAQNLYNVHIKDLCKIYIQLWDGAEERADEQAERMAEAEVERRQRLQDMMARDTQHPHEEEAESSLLDVQRGENEDNDDRDQEYQEEYVSKSKSHRRASRTGNNDQTVTVRGYKRSAPSGRTYQSQYLRKKFQLNNPGSSDRFAREREQRKYERERDKIRAERDLHPNKQFTKLNEKEDDMFVIMKAAYSIAIAQGHGEFVWKRTADRVKKEAERIDKAMLEKAQRGELTPQIENQNKKYEIHYEKSEQKGEVETQKSKWQHKSYNYYPYPSYNSHHQHKHQHFKGFQGKPHGESTNMAPQSKTHPQSYKHSYYYPYGYNMYQQYHPRDKSYDYKEKQRQRQRQRQRERERQKERVNGEKGYEYASMPYQWPYHPPYYMPQAQPGISAQDQTITKTGSTNININFPMYMCPPPHTYSAPPRYPPSHPSPYMNYDYPPYPQTHPLPGRDLGPIPQNPTYQSPPPPIYQNHYPTPYQTEKKGHQSHHSFPNTPHSSVPSHPSLPPQQMSHQGYHPYMHPYPQHYPSHPNQHQNPSSKF